MIYKLRWKSRDSYTEGKQELKPVSYFLYTFCVNKTTSPLQTSPEKRIKEALNFQNHLEVNKNSALKRNVRK